MFGRGIEHAVGGGISTSGLLRLPDGLVLSPAQRAQVEAGPFEPHAAQLVGVAIFTAGSGFFGWLAFRQVDALAVRAGLPLLVFLALLVDEVRGGHRGRRRR